MYPSRFKLQNNQTRSLIISFLVALQFAGCVALQNFFQIESETENTPSPDDAAADDNNNSDSFLFLILGALMFLVLTLLVVLQSKRKSDTILPTTKTKKKRKITTINIENNNSSSSSSSSSNSSSSSSNSSGGRMPYQEMIQPKESKGRWHCMFKGCGKSFSRSNKCKNHISDHYPIIKKGRAARSNIDKKDRWQYGLSQICLSQIHLRQSQIIAPLPIIRITNTEKMLKKLFSSVNYKGTNKNTTQKTLPLDLLVAVQRHMASGVDYGSIVHAAKGTPMYSILFNDGITETNIDRNRITIRNHRKNTDLINKMNDKGSSSTTTLETRSSIPAFVEKDCCPIQSEILTDDVSNLLKFNPQPLVKDTQRKLKSFR